jgi:phytoene synthase
MEYSVQAASISVERRLALAYAPAPARALWLGLFALDARLGAVVRSTHEPLLAQIKLAWWRDELTKPAAARQPGEPLLALLAAWGDQVDSLRALVDGWELLLDDEPLQMRAMQQIAEARAQACAGLAARLNLAEAERETGRAARGWALAELAAALSDPDQKAMALGLIAQQNWLRVRLPRELRPLQVLHGLAARQRGNGPLMPGPMAGLRAVRLGLLGI